MEETIENPWEKWKEAHYDQCPIFEMHRMVGKLSPERPCKGCAFLGEIYKKDPYNRGVTHAFLSCDGHYGRTNKRANWSADYPACWLWSPEEETDWLDDIDD